MNRVLAKKVFDNLFEVIQKNNFSDVFTFLLERTYAEKLLFDFTSTDLKAAQLAILSEEDPLIALNNLSWGIRSYFTKVQGIPLAYSDKMLALESKVEIRKTIDKDIYMLTLSEQKINLSEVLRSKEITAIINLADYIINNLDATDDDFISGINNI